MSRPSFAKRDREQAKRAKAEAKRQRRIDLAAEEAPEEAREPESTAELLHKIEEIHRRHEEGEISDDELQETKADLLSRLQVD